MPETESKNSMWLQIIINKIVLIETLLISFCRHALLMNHPLQECLFGQALSYMMDSPIFYGMDRQTVLWNPLFQLTVAHIEVVPLRW